MDKLKEYLRFKTVPEIMHYADQVWRYRTKTHSNDNASYPKDIISIYQKYGFTEHIKYINPLSVFSDLIIQKNVEKDGKINEEKYLEFVEEKLALIEEYLDRGDVITAGFNLINLMPLYGEIKKLFCNSEDGNKNININEEFEMLKKTTYLESINKKIKRIKQYLRENRFDEARKEIDTMSKIAEAMKSYKSEYRKLKSKIHKYKLNMFIRESKSFIDIFKNRINDDTLNQKPALIDIYKRFVSTEVEEIIKKIKEEKKQLEIPLPILYKIEKEIENIKSYNPKHQQNTS